MIKRMCDCVKIRVNKTGINDVTGLYGNARAKEEKKQQRDTATISFIRKKWLGNNLCVVN